MYAGVPTMPPSVFAPPAAPAAACAIPKSVTTTRLSLATSTLSGLRSRWTTPAECAADMPAQTSFTMWSTSASGSLPRLAITLESASPSTNSIVRNFSPSCSPMSKVRATLRCVTRRASFASCRKRASIPGESTRSRLSTFERDELVELHVARAIHRAHPPGPEQAQHLVAPRDPHRPRRHERARRGAPAGQHHGDRLARARRGVVALAGLGHRGTHLTIFGVDPRHDVGRARSGSRGPPGRYPSCNAGFARDGGASSVGRRMAWRFLPESRSRRR